MINMFALYGSRQSACDNGYIIATHAINTKRCIANTQGYMMGDMRVRLYAGSLARHSLGGGLE